jgi:agmatine deiminase
MIPNPTPRERGFSMPPEWAPHAATWMAWPCDDDLWMGELEPVRKEFAAFVSAIAAHEPVHLLVQASDAEQDARERLKGANVRYHHYRYDDVWLRDSGPIFIANGDRLRLLNWEFNGWGQKYTATRDNGVPRAVAGLLDTKTIDTGVVLEGGSIEVNGAGAVLTTRQCLHSKKRNPSLTEADLERILRDTLGASDVLWLDAGLEGDHTDGHIDTITRFVDASTIVTVSGADTSDANYEVTRANTERLRTFRDAKGEPYRIVELPLPKKRMEFECERLPLTYANFYIVNGAVLVPIYGDANDGQALEILKPLFPGRSVQGLMARHLITGGGAFHCVTQQQPAGTVVDAL